MNEIKLYLNAIDPRLWNVTMALVIGGIVQGFKTYLPAQWGAIPSRWKVIPAMAIGALLGGTSSADGVVALVLDAALGSFSGLTAAGGHEFVDRMKKKMGPPSAVEAAIGEEPAQEQPGKNESKS